MSRRVFLSKDVFRISKPGYDAATTGYEGLQFSEIAQSMAPHIKGSWSCPAATFASNGIRQSYGKSIIYLPAPGVFPLMLILADVAINYGGSLSFTINSAKTQVDIQSAQAIATSGRYVVFKNRQY